VSVTISAGLAVCSQAERTRSPGEGV